MTRPLVDVIRDIWERQDSAGVPRFAVFPCSRSKKPFYRSGHKYGRGHNSATAQDEIMAEMFDGFTSDTHHIGIAGGPASGGIFALDIDVKNPLTPDRMRDIQTIDEYIRIQYGDIPATASQKTPSGGKHYLFSEPVIGTLNDVFDGRESGLFADLKGNGGYFILYDYDIDIEAISPPPAWLVEYYSARSSQKSEPFTPGEKITKGNRNVKITQAAGKFWSFGLAPEYLLPYLTGLNNLYCDPPLLQKEIERITQSAIDNFDRSWEQTEINPRSLFDNLRTAADALAPQPPVEWLIQDFIASGVLAMIYGDAGCGKTWLLLHMMACIATGTSWAGHAVKQGPILIIDEESGGHRLARRLQKILKPLDGDENTPIYYLTMNSIQISDRETMSQLAEIIAEKNISVVMFDSLMDILQGADENAAKDIVPAFQNCKSIIERQGTSFIFIHHSRKDGNGYRGSSAIKGNVDLLVEVHKPKSSDIMRVNFEKNRDGETANHAVKLYFSDVDFRIEKFEGRAPGTLTDTEKFILNFIVENGPSGKLVIEAQAKINNVKNSKNTIYNLIEKGYIERTNPGGSDKIQAVYAIPTARMDEVKALLERETAGNLENI